MDGEAAGIEGDDPFAQLRDVFSGRRALLLEDDPALSEHVAERLLRAGFEAVERVDSGEAAIERAKSDRPDLILMDVVMPGLNGFQATRAITRDEATKHIPVIICTTKDQETDKIWGLRQGAKDYVTKPINEADLIDKIKAFG